LLNEGNQVDVKVALQDVVWDDRVMAVTVNVTTVDGGSLPSADTWLHITVGTVDKSVKPVESNNLLQKWHDGGDGIQALSVGDGTLVVDGIVRAF